MAPLLRSCMARHCRGSFPARRTRCRRSRQPRQNVGQHLLNLEVGVCDGLLDPVRIPRNVLAKIDKKLSEINLLKNKETPCFESTNGSTRVGPSLRPG